MLLKNRTKDLPLPDYLQNRLKAESTRHKEVLQRKLNDLCDSSDWNTAGNSSLINNLSDRVLTKTETAVLSLGLKFDVGGPNRHLQDFVIRNHRYGDSDLEKGFKQEITVCMTALASIQISAIPRRFEIALQELQKDPSILITTADKGGGVVIMNIDDYITKMKSLLQDHTTYESVKQGTCSAKSNTFTRQARKILRQTDAGKKLQYLLEEKPKPPLMRGQPKTHKVGVPMRPITSGIGSAPHRLAKHLAKPLTQCLGVMSPTHLKNSADLLQKLKNVAHWGKKMVSFDVKSLFTNVSVDGAMRALRKVLDLADVELPVPKEDYIKLVGLCVKFGSFEFQGEEYTQINGLAMGSPLSAVLANLYMELLEKEDYLPILGDSVSMFRYVDDMIAFIPDETNVEDLLGELNGVEPAIQFTCEEEKDDKIPFLDVVIIRSAQGLKFSVHRKPTNKDDFVHYFSSHSEGTKRGIVIGFFLRAYRICSPEYLQEEIDYITKTFIKLRFPESLVVILQRKAQKIKCRAGMQHQAGTNKANEEAKLKTTLVVPSSQQGENIIKSMAENVRIVASSGKKIAEMVRKKRAMKRDRDSIVYKIPCSKCDKSYFGETGRGLGTRIKEHKNDLRNHRTTKAIVHHADEAGHLPKWNDAEPLHANLTKTQRWLIEAAYIKTGKAINMSPGFFKLHDSIAERIKKEATRYAEG